MLPRRCQSWGRVGRRRWGACGITQPWEHLTPVLRPGRAALAGWPGQGRARMTRLTKPVGEPGLRHPAPRPRRGSA